MVCPVYMQARKKGVNVRLLTDPFRLEACTLVTECKAPVSRPSQPDKPPPPIMGLVNFHLRVRHRPTQEKARTGSPAVQVPA